MNKIKLFYPNGMDSIWHHNFDGSRTYRLDGVEKVIRLRDKLIKNPIFEVIPIKDTDPEILKSIHSTEYIDALISGNPKALAETSGLIWQPNLAQVFANSSQALFLAAQTALIDGASGLVSKGGGHHAINERGFGFNPVNEIAICVEKIHQKDPNLRIAIIDLDVHIANGLQQLLANHLNVILVDIWNKKLPKWGQESYSPNIYSMKVNNLEDYFNKLDKAIDKIAKFEPELIIYHSGIDVLETDRMSGVEGFSEKDFYFREDLIAKFAVDKMPIVVIPGGGYLDHKNSKDPNKELDRLVEISSYSFEVLNTGGGT